MFKKIFIISIFFTLFSCVSEVDHHRSVNEVADRDGVKTIEKKNVDYVFGVSEIPLLEGLQIVEDKTTTFSTINGNITIAHYKTDINLNRIRDFYMTTLPQIGYDLESDNKRLIYLRKNDKLELSFANLDSTILVKFLISSQNE